jgi:RHS repeat-associated protein
MTYDHMGRRRTKDGQQFFYDGYLCIGKIEDSTSIHYSLSPIHCFVWDPTEPVATRPLVWNRASGSSHPALYYAHDGNKNVSEVVDSDVGIAAHYEYAPFGAVIAQHGELAELNPWRFSSEYAEDDTATIYYNYRHYEPEMGRWASRDLMEEGGGLSLLGLKRNNLQNHFDLNGCLELKVLSWRETGFWEYLTTGYKFLEREVNSLEDIQIVDIGEDSSVWGAFIPAAEASFEDMCTVVLGSLKIGYKKLPHNIDRQSVIRYTTHTSRENGGGVVVSGRGDLKPPYGLVEAHELGHARYYLDVIVPEFRTLMKNWPRSAKDESEREKIRREYRFLMKRHDRAFGTAANEPTIKWLMNSGYKYEIK